jgi:AcrR family transcriptional regulator
MARKQGSHSDITGPKVREAALRLIARHGYAAVSMRQLAAEVGVQAGALYNYTPDKQTLLFDLMRDHLVDVIESFDKADPKTDANSRLRAFVSFHIRYHLPRADAVFVAYMELRNLEPENFAAIEKLRRAYEDRLEAILRQGEAEGAFAMKDARVATRAIIGMLTGFFTWYRQEGRLPLEEVEAIYWDLVGKAVAR